MTADHAARADAIRRIAARELGIETLESRRSDSLDFHDVAVWTLEDVVRAIAKVRPELGGMLEERYLRWDVAAVGV